MCSSLQRFSARQLVDLAMNNLTDTVTVQQFYQLCPSLLQQMLMTSEAGLGAQDVEVEDTKMDEMDDSMPASAMQSECIQNQNQNIYCPSTSLQGHLSYGAQ